MKKEKDKISKIKEKTKKPKINLEEKGTQVKMRKFNKTQMNLYLDIFIIICSAIVIAAMQDKIVVVIIMAAIILSRIYYIHKGYKELVRK